MGATLIQVLGNPGTGKTMGVKTLDAKKTFYINCDKKNMPFKGWKSLYNIENKNYMQTSDPVQIEQLLKAISERRKEITVVIIDTVNSIMSDFEMQNAKNKGFDKWTDMAKLIYDLYRLVPELREDMIIFSLAHIDEYQTREFETKQRLKTNGLKLTKLNLEGLTTYTFYTKVERSENEVKYVLETQTNGYNTARTPEGLFDLTIPNDFNYIVNKVIEYEQ